LLDKDFLFQQRVWYLTRTPSIDGLTSGGDNISVEHNHGTVYRIKPRTNLDVNRWWISDEIRWGWKFIHDESRRRVPAVRGHDAWAPEHADEAWNTALATAMDGLRDRSIACMISPMLTCEDAWHLGRMARRLDPNALLAVGPVPVSGEDKTFPGGYTMRAEKAPNARGVRRVLDALGGTVTDAAGFEAALTDGGPDAVVLTGNYPSAWVTDSMKAALGDRFTLLLDTMPNRLDDRADVFLPTATWMEKSGTFENVDGRLQAFERAIEPVDYCKSESQIAIDLLALHDGVRPDWFNAAMTRQTMATESGLKLFLDAVHMPEAETTVESDMELIEL
ncbi:MAG: molybdopterin-dependent oxidoreductase, partial [Phycisphaerales bacterium]|nr:molybdopterin-dependent oxidoreductase [Phycisphaerales bacterium]